MYLVAYTQCVQLKVSVGTKWSGVWIVVFKNDRRPSDFVTLSENVSKTENLWLMWHLVFWDNYCIKKDKIGLDSLNPMINEFV